MDDDTEQTLALLNSGQLEPGEYNVDISIDDNDVEINFEYNDEGISISLDETIRDQVIDINSLIEALIQHFPGLTFLSMSNNDLITLPERIGDLTNLTELYLNNNRLTTLPERISNLTNLTFLNLGYNQFTTLPERICDLTNLTDLYLNHNQLTSLSDSIYNLTNLRKLNLYENSLVSIPERGNLPTLTRTGLSLYNTPGSSRRRNNLDLLDFLNLSNNRLTSLPESIGNLPSLITLHLNNNQLTTLPSSIGNLPNLRELALNNNQLTSLPSSIGNLPKLQNISFTGSVIFTDCKYMYEFTNRHVYDYFLTPGKFDIERFNTYCRKDVKYATSKNFFSAKGPYINSFTDPNRDQRPTRRSTTMNSILSSPRFQRHILDYNAKIDDVRDIITFVPTGGRKRSNRKTKLSKLRKNTRKWKFI